MIEVSNQHLDVVYLDFVKVADRLNWAVYVISKEKEYSFPVVVVTTESAKLGSLLIGPGELGNRFYYYVVYLQILLQAGIVNEEGVIYFKKVYKDPNKFCCLLVMYDQMQHFIYLPYPTLPYPVDD